MICSENRCTLFRIMRGRLVQLRGAETGGAGLWLRFGFNVPA